MLRNWHGAVFWFNNLAGSQPSASKLLGKRLQDHNARAFHKNRACGSASKRF